MTIIPPEKLGTYLPRGREVRRPAHVLPELSSGLRRRELLALLWDDLNVKDRILSVSKQVTRIDGELVITEPKTQNSVRRVALSQQAVDILVRSMNSTPTTPSCSHRPAPVATGAQMRCPGSIASCWQWPVSRSMCAFHDLRHTFATMALFPAAWM